MADRWPAPIRELVGWYPCVLLLALLACRNGTTLLLVAASFYAVHSVRLLESPGRLLAGALGASPVLVEAQGIVVADPKPNPTDPDRWTFPLRIEEAHVPGPGRRRLPASDAVALVRWEGPAPQYGDRLRLVATAQPPRPTRNPAQFDAAAWLARRGILTELRLRTPGDGGVRDRRVGNPLLHAALDVRHWMLGCLALGLDDAPEIRGTMAGIVLGITADTPEELTEEFRRTGTLHLFAVSGLHVGMFAFLAWLVVRPLPLPRPGRLLLILPLLAFYAAITGLAPSVLRATVMAYVVLGGRILERPSRMLNNLALAGFVLLLWDTHDLFDAGFQLSFGVVFTLVLIAAPLARRLRPWFQPDPFVPDTLRSPIQKGGARAGLWMAGALATSIAAWVGSAPLGLHYFHLVSPVAVLSNLVVIPISFSVLALGLLSIAGGVVSPWIATAFNHLNAYASAALLGCVHLFSLLPLGWFHAGGFSPPGETGRITVLDLGQAQCVVVQSRGQAWVLDPGSPRDYETVIRPFLRSHGLDRVGGLVLSHGDARHIGAAGLFTIDFHPRTIVVPAAHDRSAARRAFERQLAESGTGRSLVFAGQHLGDPPAPVLEILHPPPGLDRRVADDKGLVIRWQIGGVRVLTMADAGLTTEQALLGRGTPLDADLLVLGRHGTDPVASSAFLDAVRPRAIIAGATAFPESEQIPPAWAAGVARRGIALYRQDRTGAVTIRIRRRQVAIEPFLESELSAGGWVRGPRPPSPTR